MNLDFCLVFVVEEIRSYKVVFKENILTSLLIFQTKLYNFNNKINSLTAF